MSAQQICNDIHEARAKNLSRQHGCRWLVRRAPHMTRISCKTSSDEAAWMLRGVLPELSGLIGPTVGLSISLDWGRLSYALPVHIYDSSHPRGMHADMPLFPLYSDCKRSRPSSAAAPRLLEAASMSLLNCCQCMPQDTLQSCCAARQASSRMKACSTSGAPWQTASQS